MSKRAELAIQVGSLNNKTMKQILFILALIISAIGCQYLTEQVAPIDWVYNPPVQVDTSVVDTIINDTLPIVVDTPCVPELVTEPKFVTLYLEFDILEPNILWQGGQVESNDLADVVAAVTSLPFTIYNEGKSWAVIIDGTNDNQSFYLKIFARSNGAKIYMGAIKQGFIFAGALTFDEFKEVAIKYQSVDRFNFRVTQYDSLQYIELANIILGDCKAGRTWADFRFNPFQMDTAIINKFIAADWDNVLN